MKTKETEILAFFDFPIEHFADRSTRWLLEDRENVRGLLEDEEKPSSGGVQFSIYIC